NGDDLAEPRKRLIGQLEVLIAWKSCSGSQKDIRLCGRVEPERYEVKGPPARSVQRDGCAGQWLATDAGKERRALLLSEGALRRGIKQKGGFGGYRDNLFFRRIGPYRVHPVAALFPLLQGQEFEKFKASIQKY